MFFIIAVFAATVYFLKICVMIGILGGLTSASGQNEEIREAVGYAKANC